MGTMELLAGPYPTVLHWADPVGRQTGTRDTRIYPRQLGMDVLVRLEWEGQVGAEMLG